MLDKRTQKLTLFDEKLSQFALVFLMLIIIRAFPRTGDMSLWLSIPLCAACSIWPLSIYWGWGRKQFDKDRFKRRMQQFTFRDLVVAHLAFVFALYIAIEVVPALKEVWWQWSVSLFAGFVIKPFYAFWIKK